MITTSLVGNLLVIAEPNGELEVTPAPGQTTLDFVQIHSILRAQAGDHYDFMSCYLDVASGVPNLGSASSSIFQDATGIGRWTFNQRPDWGTSKLQHYAVFSFFSLNTLLHEIGHRWLGAVNYRETPSGPTQTLLHEDWIWSPGQAPVHWGRWLDDQNSCMDYDQAEWIDNGAGGFNRIDRDPNIPAHDAWFGYCALDQYLMGLIPASAVPSMKIVRSPTPALSEGGPYGVPTGPYTPNPSALSVSIAQVQTPRPDEPASFSGPRNPDYLNSQRVFHEAVVVISRNPALGTIFIANSDNWRSRHTANFRRATSGRAMIDTSLLRSNYASLYMKDNVADVGAGPSAAPFWLSPDLWVRNADDGQSTHQDTIRGQNNWLYARVRNKSQQDYQNVTVNFYLANFATLVPGTQFLYPVDWNPQGLLGSGTIASVPKALGGVDGEAIAKVVWTADKIPAATGWHPCLLCEIIPAEVTPAGLHRVYENRKLAQRNLTIVDPLTAAGAGPGRGVPGGGGPAAFLFEYPFVVGHELGAGKTTLGVRAERHFPEAHLFLELGELAEGFDQPVVAIEARLGLTSDKASDVRWIDEIDFRARDASSGGKADRQSKLRPVRLDGRSLIQILDPYDAELELSLPPGRRVEVRLVCIVSPFRGRGESAVYHITEAANDAVVGGLSLQVQT